MLRHWSTMNVYMPSTFLLSAYISLAVVPFKLPLSWSSTISILLLTNSTGSSFICSLSSLVILIKGRHICRYISNDDCAINSWWASCFENNVNICKECLTKVLIWPFSIIYSKLVFCAKQIKVTLSSESNWLPHSKYIYFRSEFQIDSGFFSCT